MTDRKSLAGKIALVTGGCGAIASASASRLLDDGATVLLMDLRRDALETTMHGLLSKHPAASIAIHAGDARDPAAVQAALAAAAALDGELSIVVATVGTGAFRPLLMHDLDTFRAELDLNLGTAFLAIRYGAPLLSRGGSIICFSSTSATVPFPWMSSYSAAKGGLEKLVRAAAEELGAAGIRVNYVRPGFTRTAATAPVFADPALVDKFLHETPLARTGEPDDIAEAVRYLAGPESAWVTGQGFAIDGGMELRRNPGFPEIAEAIYGVEAMRAVLSGKAPI